MAKWTKTTRDASHIDIQRELRKRGFCVIDLSGVGGDVPDLLVASLTTMCLVELKESLDSLITVAQIEYIAQWKGNVMIALSVDDVVNGMQDELFITGEEKDKMLQIVHRQRVKSIAKQPQMTVGRLRKLMYGTTES